jgi:hypothetical protein
MHSIKFYKLWHVDSLDEYQKSVPGEFVNLEKLPCPPYLKTAWPFLQEYRSHFSDLSANTDYVGFVSASFAQKFGLANNDLLIQRLQAADYENYDLTPIVSSRKDWVAQANHWHPGIQKYIDHYCELAKIEKQFLENSIFYCNSFICKTELYEKAKRIYTQNLILTLESFNYKLDYNGTIYDDVRKGGCLCERLWSLTLSSVCEKKNAGIANIIVQGLVT